MTNNTPILLFGSADFPVPTFEYLIKEGYNVKGIVTSKDKLMFYNKSVKDIAVEYNIPYIICKDTNSDELYNWIKDLGEIDYFVVISYKILPERILSLSKYAFNVHASLLPFLRGANPIHWALRLGFEKTGLTSFHLSNKCDQGNIIDSISTDIVDDDNFETLYRRLSEMCVLFTVKTLYLAKRISVPQPYIPKQIIKKNSVLNMVSDVINAPKLTHFLHTYGSWHNLHEDVLYNEIRALLPVHGIRVFIESNMKFINLKIWDCDVEKLDYNISRDYISTDNKTFFTIYTPHLKVDVKEVQEDGKKRLKINDWLNGKPQLKSGCKVPFLHEVPTEMAQ